MNGSGALWNRDELQDVKTHPEGDVLVVWLKGCDSGPHDLYNGESQAVKAWLIERAEMDTPS